jgi:ribosomal protein RSM22 (predicted rRNA methylase)
MQLPPALRNGIDRALDGVTDLATTAAALSERYRSERRGGTPYVANRRDALAYLATRMPATYAAARAALAAVAEARPDFAPATLLDIGAGPGTVLWAATDCWPGIDDALLIEASAEFGALGEEIAAEAALPRWTWRIADATKALNSTPADLVTAAYVLNELAPDERSPLVDQLWRLTAETLVIVEPGTPAGWQRILAARKQLIDAGAHIVAPCPHAYACPLQPPDWCHFAQRVARSRVHRQAKAAELPWEDEKFSYVAVSRRVPAVVGPRVIAHPQKASGRVTLKLCRPDGSAAQQLFSRRDGKFKRARRSDWGSSL